MCGRAINGVAFHRRPTSESRRFVSRNRPTSFEVQLAQAKGQLAKDQATLANARLDLARYQKLAKTHLVSQQELDNQAAFSQTV